MALVHEFSWSVSRDSLLGECARSYYYNYYLSWLGWDGRAAPERKAAYKLKKLHSLATYAGDALHQSLAGWFERKRRTGEAASAEEVKRDVLARLRRGWVESRDKAAAWERSPNKTTRLREHYYGEESANEASGEAGRYGKRYVERLEQSVDHFFASPALAAVRNSDPSAWLACEEMGTIPLFDAKVFAIPDFAQRWGDEIWIYDWKTGSPRERDRFQLALYTLYAESKWGVDPTTVRTVDAYLPVGQEVEATFDRAELDGVLTTIGTSIQRMRDLHFDAAASAGDRDAFPMLPEGASECGRCNFRELCGR